MSELADVVRSSLTDEWRSTREIAFGILIPRGITVDTHYMEVWRILRRMELEGFVEGRPAQSAHGKGKPKEWRLRA